jgi:hypothetical protein
VLDLLTKLYEREFGPVKQPTRNEDPAPQPQKAEVKKVKEDDDWDLSEKSVKTGNKYLDNDLDLDLDLDGKSKENKFFDNKDYNNILDSIPTI